MRRSVRKVFACFLALCLAVCSFPVSAAAENETLKITVAADTHYQCAADLGVPSDQYTEYMLEPELYGYASTQGQMPYESEAILSAMLDAFCASDSPYLLIIAIAAGIAVSVLLERLSRKKRHERPVDEDDAENAPDLLQPLNCIDRHRSGQVNQRILIIPLDLT